ASLEPSSEALSSTSTSDARPSASRSAATASRQRIKSSRPLVLTTQKEICTSTRVLSGSVKVQVVDPSAYTPPYDHALCAALAAAGVEVELVTSRFPYAQVQPPDGYARRELFYRRALRAPGSPLPPPPHPPHPVPPLAPPP